MRHRLRRRYGRSAVFGRKFPVRPWSKDVRMDIVDYQTSKYSKPGKVMPVLQRHRPSEKAILEEIERLRRLAHGRPDAIRRMYAKKIAALEEQLV